MDEPELEVINWEEIGKRAELKKGGKRLADPTFLRLNERLAKASVVLVEVEEGGAQAAFTYFFRGSLDAGGYAVPIVGATTPYDIAEFKDAIGAKSAAWVTAAPAEDAWIAEKFNIIKPSNLFEITPFIKAIGAKTTERVFFVSDMLDEIYDLVAEKEFHAFLSRLHSLMKGTPDLLLLIIKPALYSREYLAMMERYADAKISFGERIDYVDFRTNAKERIK